MEPVAKASNAEGKETSTSDETCINGCEEHASDRVTYDHNYWVQPQDKDAVLRAALIEIERLQAQNVTLHNERHLYSHLSLDDNSVNFYIGFVDYQILMTFFSS